MQTTVEIKVIAQITLTREIKALEYDWQDNGIRSLVNSQKQSFVQYSIVRAMIVQKIFRFDVYLKYVELQYLQRGA